MSQYTRTYCCPKKKNENDAQSFYSHVYGPKHKPYATIIHAFKACKRKKCLKKNETVRWTRKNWYE